MPLQYPLSAIVPSQADDRDDMTLALVLTTISPEVGGVLVRGEKGTAKSTDRARPRLRAAADRGGRRRPVLEPPGDTSPTADWRPMAARRRDRDPARTPRRAARRRHRGPRARLAAPVQGAGRRRRRVRARPPRPRPPRHPLRRRGQPPPRPPRRPAARRRRDGPLHRRARRRLGRPRRPLRARRHHEPRGGRAPPPAPRPLRPHRRDRRAARPAGCAPRSYAVGSPSTPTRRPSSRRTPTPSAR